MNRESYKELINRIIEEYLNTPELERSLTKLSSKYGVKRQTIAKYLKESGHEVINYQNLCNIDEHVFDNIDTEEKAYWLGFLYADGSIGSKEFKLELNLSAKDIDHMKKFKTFMKSTAKDRIDTSKGPQYPTCRFSVRNKNVWNQLNIKGCTPNKTLTLTFPELTIFSNTKLVKDFMRGYVDGDGSLGLYSGKYGRSFHVSIAGTQMFLQGLQSQLGITGTIRNASCNAYKSKIYILHYSGLKARKVSRILYENANIYLTRKYNIYKLFCQAEEESSVLKSSKIGESCDANTEVIS